MKHQFNNGTCILCGVQVSKGSKKIHLLRDGVPVWEPECKGKVKGGLSGSKE